MKSVKQNQYGVLHLQAILLLVLVVAAIGGVGAYVLQKSKAASSGIDNGVAVLNSRGDTWSAKDGVSNKYFWPTETKCGRSPNYVSTLHGGVFGNNGNQVNYIFGRTINGQPKLFLCKAPIDKPQTATELTLLADSAMDTYEASGYEFLKNPIIAADSKLAIELRLSGQSQSVYKVFNPSNGNLKKLDSFGQSMGYQWKAASSTEIITYRMNYPYNKCVYDISTDKSNCVETSLPKETSQVFMPRSNDYIIYATRTIEGGKPVGAIWKADLNGGNKKKLKDNIDVLRILALSPSETKVMYNGNYEAKLLNIGDSSVSKVSDAQTFSIWQPIPPKVAP